MPDLANEREVEVAMDYQAEACEKRKARVEEYVIEQWKDQDRVKEALEDDPDLVAQIFSKGVDVLDKVNGLISAYFVHEFNKHD